MFCLYFWWIIVGGNVLGYKGDCCVIVVKLVNLCLFRDGFVGFIGVYCDCGGMLGKIKFSLEGKVGVN